MKYYLFFILLSFTFIPKSIASSGIEQQSSLTSVNTTNEISTLLSPEEKHYIETHQSIKVCNVEQATGANASLTIVSLIAKKSGLNLNASPHVSWQDALQGLKSGFCDILPWATMTKERITLMNFTYPFARVKRVVITQRHQSYFRNLTEVEDKRFVSLANNNAVKQIKEQFPDLKFNYVSHIEEALNEVSDGNAYGMIANLYSAASIFNNESRNNLKVAGILPENFDDVLSLATRKEDILLHSILEKSLLTTDSDIINNFMKQGAVVTYEPEVDYQRYWLTALVISFVVFMLIFWNRHLKSINARLESSQLALNEKTTELELLSTTDPLTKIPNRHKIEEVLIQEISRSERYKHSLSIIVIDIDNFKEINDQHGHLAGDKVLIQFSSVLKDSLRANDVLGRWGGEEFLVICPSTNINEAEKVAEKLRKAAEKTLFSPVQNITASFGVSQRLPSDTRETLIGRADKAMYSSKRQGKNRVSTSLDNN